MVSSKWFVLSNFQTLEIARIPPRISPGSGNRIPGNSKFRISLWGFCGAFHHVQWLPPKFGCLEFPQELSKVLKFPQNFYYPSSNREKSFPYNFPYKRNGFLEASGYCRSTNGYNCQSSRFAFQHSIPDEMFHFFLFANRNESKLSSKFDNLIAVGEQKFDQILHAAELRLGSQLITDGQSVWRG